jgi:hypothetical protein
MWTFLPLKRLENSKIRKFLFILRLTFDLPMAMALQAQQTQMTSQQHLTTPN